MILSKGQVRSLDSMVSEFAEMPVIREGDRVWFRRSNLPGTRIPSSFVSEVTCVWDNITGQINVKFWDGHALCVQPDVFPFDGKSGWSKF